MHFAVFSHLLCLRHIARGLFVRLRSHSPVVFSVAGRGRAPLVRVFEPVTALFIVFAFQRSFVCLAPEH